MTKRTIMLTLPGLLLFAVAPLLYYRSIHGDFRFADLLPMVVVQALAVALHVLLLVPGTSNTARWRAYIWAIIAANLWAFSIVCYWYYVVGCYGYFDIGIWPYPTMALGTGIGRCLISS